MPRICFAAALAAVLAAAACSDRGGAAAPVRITVTRNGYEPWRVEARKGVPLTLVVTRTTDETCATELVLPEYGIDRKLPLNEPVTIAFTPARAGTLRYACAMKMFQGEIDVR
ncbi:MAG TPA: cupredoxin domain-containing protein [Anaeromyxobacter sp.]